MSLLGESVYNDKKRTQTSEGDTCGLKREMIAKNFLKYIMKVNKLLKIFYNVFDPWKIHDD